MTRFLENVHRFLWSQSLYALLLSTVLALGMFAARAILSQNTFVFRNLVWNLFLAWIPYSCAFLAAGLHRLFPGRWFLLPLPAIAWLAFFPNAPYLVTDFLHLQPRPGIPLWYDILLITAFAWNGCFLAVASLWSMQYLTRYYLGAWVSWLFVAGALGLSGLGVYLGRFSRFNSWDLLTSPRAILYDILIPFLNPRANLTFFGFTLLFTAFLFVMYLTFFSMHRGDELEERRV
jgi:uncharacterized membrane protein